MELYDLVKYAPDSELRRWVDTQETNSVKNSRASVKSSWGILFLFALGLYILLVATNIQDTSLLHSVTGGILILGILYANAKEKINKTIVTGRSYGSGSRC